MRSGDIIQVDFGIPIGSEAGFIRPAIVIAADEFLHFRPSTVFAVPLASTPHAFPSHVSITPDETNQLAVESHALVEQMRAVATERCTQTAATPVQWSFTRSWTSSR